MNVGGVDSVDLLRAQVLSGQLDGLEDIMDGLPGITDAIDRDKGE
ncbi:hypothetical protein MNBD_GAMMA10-2755 [hydrothermal vent metagenome]|uniref:Uncharacterized protein n=1 Tax=hydrothermal vent metagenome TaxID=652676 RepID=A0A3B0XK88_9ZZZZ